MNRRTPFVPAALAGLTLALALAAPAVARAGEPGEARDKEKDKVDKIVTVRMLPGGEEPEVKVFDGKPVPRGYLGVGLTDLTPELRTHFGVPDEAGVMVSRVEPGSPAEKAGLKVGDIVTAFDGKPIESSFDLRLRVREAGEGDQAPIEVWRNGKAQTVTATMEKRERPEFDLGPMFLKRGDGKRLLLGDGDLKRLDLPMDEILEQVQTVPRVRMQRINSREAELEKQLKELEKRIAELEKQLQKR